MVKVTTIRATRAQLDIPRKAAGAAESSAPDLRVGASRGAVQRSSRIFCGMIGQARAADLRAVRPVARRAARAARLWSTAFYEDEFKGNRLIKYLI